MAVLRPAGDYDRSYEQDMAIIRKPWQWVLLGLSLAVLFWAPQWGNAYITAVINQIGYTIIALQGLNLLTGYTGQISLGQAAFKMGCRPNRRFRKSRRPSSNPTNSGLSSSGLHPIPGK
jgi:branched-chain amino acid transport system permease protein